MNPMNLPTAYNRNMCYPNLPTMLCKQRNAHMYHVHAALVEAN